MTEPTAPDHHDPHTKAEIRRARREFLLDAAIEAERDTGRREKTDEEAKHSLWMRIARLVGGWILVLLGLAAIPLPGPGWLMVLLGLTLLPYRWTDNLIREIRKRIPGIPEDGRIPTRTWIITGVLVVAATAGSLWWGLRDKGEDDAKGDETEQASGARTTTTEPPADLPTLVAASPAEPARAQLTAIYGAVAAHLTDSTSKVVEGSDACSVITAGDADIVLLTEAEVPTCLGPPENRSTLVVDAGVKLYAPVVSAGITYVPVVRSDTIAIDDEPAELTLDGVSSQISAGDAISGDPADRAEELMVAAGVLK